MTNDVEFIKKTLTGIDVVLVSKFVDFHLKNPHVYEAFTKLANQMRQTGKKQYGARTIVEIIRWQIDLKTTDNVFRFNNDFSPLYARLLMAADPNFVDFFELRRMKSKRHTSWEELKRQELLS